ncbi:MAG: universal stress protein [Myxococcales bacterium]|jgi:nucleotide-binding universal stress UspA family protein
MATTFLCPTDFSDSSLAAVRYAASLAHSMGGGRIELLHVHHVPWHQADMYAPKTVEEIPEDAKQGIERSFRDMVAELSEDTKGLTLDQRLEVGVPYERICERAKDADMVVMSTMGHTGLRRLLVGSVTERVLRMCDKPVLTVRAE